MLIGEAPGKNEDERGEPFVGRAGALLDSALENAGLPRDECYVTNLVKCRPPANRRPNADEISACRKYLLREFGYIMPDAILLMGNSTLHSLTSIQSGITQSRGLIPLRKHVFPNTLVYATVHPAAALYSKELVEEFRKDIMDFVRERGLVSTAP
jgi:uracil-DNA glycosylase family 4